MPPASSDAAYRWDVAVVGAGPAGMAAAAAAAGAGCSVVLVDAGRDLGGQYWRHPAGSADGVPRQKQFTRLAATVRSSVTHLPHHEVWAVERSRGGFAAHARQDSGQRTVRSATLVIATGAIDRQLPFTGWDLPGVYTAGGAQALLKEHGVSVGRHIVVGGTGPFLLPVAAGMTAAGAQVTDVIDANSTSGWLRRLPAAARKTGRVGEAAAYRAKLMRAGTRLGSRQAIIAAHGDERVEAVTIARLGATWAIEATRRVECDAVTVGWGFTPRVELALALGCSTRMDGDGSVVVVVDDEQHTSVPGLYVAGEACGVGGATLAVAEGEIAGAAAAGRLGWVAHTPTGARRRRTSDREFAAAMHAVYPIQDGWRDWLDPDTVVCRCEEVTAASIDDAVCTLGATDARSVKLLSRAGMGWCQGRVCGFAVSRLGSPTTSDTDGELALARRPLAVPIALRQLAYPTEHEEGQ